jgi:hypothetical protein
MLKWPKLELKVMHNPTLQEWKNRPDRHQPVIIRGKINDNKKETTQKITEKSKFSTGMLDDWRASQLWTWDYLRQKAGDCTVVSKMNDGKGTRSFQNGIGLGKLIDFIERVQQPDEIWNSLPNVSKIVSC